MSDSRFHILETIKRLGSAGMDELAEATGLARTTLREHMAFLERDGFVSRKHQRTGPGRPSLRFRLTRLGHDRFPNEERDLLMHLIRYLKEADKEELLHLFFRKFWDERAANAQKLIEASETSHSNNQRSQSSKKEALVAFLEGEGFMPEIHQDSETGKIIVRECNCPFKSVVRETDLPCRLEIGFYENVLGTRVTRTAFMPDGDDSCSYLLDAFDS